MEVDKDLMKYDDYAIKHMLMKISREELEKCVENKKVPSREVLDTVETMLNACKTFSPTFEFEKKDF